MKIVQKPMKVWWLAASKKDKEALARIAQTSVAQLVQLAGGYRESGCSPVLARRIELATVRLAKTKELPVVLRSDLCPACAACEFAPKCER